MTEIILTNKECNCDPNKPSTWKKRLVITEGLTVIWSCPHVEAFYHRRTSKWESMGQ